MLLAPALYLSILGGHGIPVRTPEARLEIAQHYGEGAGFIGISDSRVAAGTDSGVAATDWTSSMGAVWLFEEPAGNNATDSTGNGNTMTNNGTVGRTTGIEGSQAADALAGTNFFSCGDATCTGIDPAAGTAFTYGCWVNFDAMAADYVWSKTNFSSTGFQQESLGSPNYYQRCRVRTTGSIADRTGTTARTTGTWYHVLCTVNDSTNLTVKLCENGVCSSETTVASVDYAPSSNTGYIVDPSAGFDGKVDECFFDNAYWSSAQSARACSVGIAGELARCDTTDPTLYKACDSNTDCGGSAVCDTGASAIDDTYCTEGGSAGCCMGRNSSYCGGAALTACNAAAP